MPTPLSVEHLESHGSGAREGAERAAPLSGCGPTSAMAEQPLATHPSLAAQLCKQQCRAVTCAGALVRDASPVARPACGELGVARVQQVPAQVCSFFSPCLTFLVHFSPTA